MTTESCQNCRFGNLEKYEHLKEIVSKVWTPDEEIYETKSRIRCRRYPIYPTEISLGAHSEHPIVDFNDWCGEWQEKKK